MNSSLNASHDLNRFVEAQASTYKVVLSELRSGKKRSHWMWYIFPQLAGLGWSVMSRRYSIANVQEAQAYLGHPLLGGRLRECATIVNGLDGLSARDMFGTPDDLKLRSCATLFARVSDEPVFQELLDKYFDGLPDDQTLRLLANQQ